MRSLASRPTPRILTLSCGSMALPRKRRAGRTSGSERLRSKWINPVLTASNGAPLSRNHRVAARSTSDCSLLVVSAYVAPVLHAAKSSIKPIDPPSGLILPSTKFVMQKTYKIGDRGEPYGIPACVIGVSAEV